MDRAEKELLSLKPSSIHDAETNHLCKPMDWVGIADLRPIFPL